MDTKHTYDTQMQTNKIIAINLKNILKRKLKKVIIFQMVQEDQEHGINVNSDEEPMVDITVGIQKKWPCSESESKMWEGLATAFF